MTTSLKVCELGCSGKERGDKGKKGKEEKTNQVIFQGGQTGTFELAKQPPRVECHEGGTAGNWVSLFPPSLHLTPCYQYGGGPFAGEGNDTPALTWDKHL